MRILVTGGAGFIGSHTVEALLARDLAVTVYDDFSTGKRENLPQNSAKSARLDVIKGDVRDYADVVRAMTGCDAVLHLAAVVSVPLSIQRPHFTHEVNATGTLNVLEAARHLGIDRVVTASSAAVYGVPQQLPLPESAMVQALSPYAAQKWLAEAYSRSYAELHGMNPVCLRYFNVFGPRQDPASPYSGVLSRFIGALVAGEGVTIHGDGQQTRDFVFVEDVARANVAALLAPEQAPGAVFNVGTGHAITVTRAYEAIATALGGAPQPAYGPARAGDVPHSRAEVSAAREALGFEAEVGFEEGLQATVDWARGRTAARSLRLSA